MRKAVAVAALAAVLTTGLGMADVAWAQSNPSVQQAIDALKPKPGKSRGSRPVVAPPAGDQTVAPTTAAAPSVAAPSVAAPSVAAPVVSAPAAATPAAAPVRQAAVPAKPVAPDPVDVPSINFNVLFASGSAELTPSAVKSLDTLGQALSSADLAGSRFRIEGHTDTVGNRDTNRSLSARRATAVVDFLSGKFKIDRSRLESAGMGQDALEIRTGDQVDEPRNRRVRVVNITG